MKRLLDENVDRDFKYLLPEHDVRHIEDMGWKGLSNGSLLDAAETERFEILLTADKRMQFQQNVPSRKLALAVLDVHPRNMANLAACVPELRRRLPAMEPVKAYVLRMPDP